MTNVFKKSVLTILLVTIAPTVFPAQMPAEHPISLDQNQPTSGTWRSRMKSRYQKARQATRQAATSVLQTLKQHPVKSAIAAAITLFSVGKAGSVALGRKPQISREKATKLVDLTIRDDYEILSKLKTRMKSNPQLEALIDLREKLKEHADEHRVRQTEESYEQLKTTHGFYMTVKNALITKSAPTAIELKNFSNEHERNIRLEKGQKEFSYLNNYVEQNRKLFGKDKKLKELGYQYLGAYREYLIKMIESPQEVPKNVQKAKKAYEAEITKRYNELKKYAEVFRMPD